MLITSSEIDSVVGSDRLPNENDAADLPYTRQCVQEYGLSNHTAA